MKQQGFELMAVKKKVTKKKTVKKSAPKTKAKSKKTEKFSEKQSQLLKDVVGIIAGQTALPIIDILHGKENVNEFDIAKKLNVTINQARNILYKLTDEGLVSFTRKKDKKNGGWYTYFWTLDTTKSLVFLKNTLLKKVEEMENQLESKKSKQFYYCPNCDIEVSEENALAYDFTCPECGEVFVLKNNEEAVEHLSLEIDGMMENLAGIEEELTKLKALEQAAFERKLKALERKKKKEREEKRKERERLKKLEAKKAGKKLVKKTTKKKATKKKAAKKKVAKKSTRKKPAKGKR